MTRLFSRLSLRGTGARRALPGPCPLAEPAATRLVPDKSQIVFVTKQMGVPVEGTFKKFDAQVAFDPKKPEGGSVALQIDTASAGFGVAMSDAELPKAPWFDAAHFPQASFQSSAIKALGDGKFEMAGKLTHQGHGQGGDGACQHRDRRRQLRGGHRKPYDPAARLQGGRRRMDGHLDGRQRGAGEVQVHARGLRAALNRRTAKPVCPPLALIRSCSPPHPTP
jgi:hypothetical protein